MDDQAAGHIHLCSEAPSVGPRGLTPEATSGDPTEDGRLEEDLEAVIEDMNREGQGLEAGRTSEERRQQHAQPATPCNHGQGPEAEESDSSD
eukprot:7831309-Alexandrium_andersonii.AAC.1